MNLYELVERVNEIVSKMPGETKVAIETCCGEELLMGIDLEPGQVVLSSTREL